MSGSLASYTVGGLIVQSLKAAQVLGVGQTPDASDSADALQQLNQMLASWQRKRWLVYGTLTTGLVSTGATTYSVGPTGDFPIPRPDRIESAYIRFLNGSGPVTVDVSLALINSREDYNKITVKNLTTFPSGVFYDNNVGNGLGTAYFWPIPPASQYQMFITTLSQLQFFSNLNQAIAMPFEYIDAMQWSLAARLRPFYGMPPDPTITGLALSSLNVLRNANAQVPSLTMPAGVPGGSPGTYNPWADRVT
jgi:hypothetical protein